MTLYEELYFEITLTGAKSELKKLVSFLKSGELEDFFEFSAEYISYDDDFDSKDSSDETSITLSNDDYGIEIEEFDTDEFLDVFCRAAKNLYIEGHIYDIDDEEYRFISEAGDSYYTNANSVRRFNEDDDKPLDEEDEED